VSEHENTPLLPSSALVVEDQPEHAELLVLDLEAMGVTCHAVANSFESAHAACAERRPEVVFADVDLGGDESGFDIACSLWSLHGIPSILVTGFDSDRVLGGDHPAGVFGYVVKPFRREQLTAAIRVAWSNFGSLRHREERIVDLEERLDQRKLIEHAKWRLVSLRGMTEAQAHAYLQQEARRTRKRLADLAIDVISELRTAS